MDFSEYLAVSVDKKGYYYIRNPSDVKEYQSMSYDDKEN